MKTVITYGTFDLFHEGHLNLLKRAKALGNRLIVGVTTEQFDVQRGKMNVVDSLMRRLDNVRNSGFADEIIIEEREGQKLEDIQKYNADIFVVGSDWTGKFDYLKEFCEVTYLPRTKNVSSSGIRTLRREIIKLGVVGTGRIAKRTMEELHFVSGITATAVFNPNPKSAKKFAEKFSIGIESSNYEQFLNEVDAVYIASPHETHYDYSRRALIAGKHVLCEKPFVLKETEAKELFEIASETNLVIMEAIKTAYSPGFLNLLAIARSGRIGKIHDIEAAFTKLVPETPKAREYNSICGGAFTELASYSLLPIVKLLGTNYSELSFDCFKNKNGIDIYSKAYFKYENSVATVKTGIGVKSEGQLLISGTNGYILVKSPWWLFKGFEVCYEDPNDNEFFSTPFHGFGMRYEFADFVQNINEASFKNFKLTKSDSIFMAKIMEEFLKKRTNSL
ncbi:MAG: Gfo/Idh/MocA family oxidoreductase [Fibromonadaceae bacterium]|jgi:choline-phosphate cytidylyltransferase|nr:Gfo/Idh/MocA family oxidoreductase [Fibromonadaceae bacterium]